MKKIMILLIIPFLSFGQTPITGCSDPSACNYDPTVNIPTNAVSCEYVTCVGCMSSNACNYDPNASIALLIESFDADGNFIYIDGCDYNCLDCNGVAYGDATEDDCGTCDNDATNDCVLGCLDIYAWNFDGLDYVDDGSCCYYACCDGMGGYLEGCVEGCMGSSACNYNPEATTTCWFGADGDGICCDYPEEGVNCDGQQLTYIPDDNFEAALISLGYDDILDDYVLTSNIENVTQLDLSAPCSAGWCQIQYLTGVEDFTQLEYLDISSNSLFELDLSQNLYLDTLIIDEVWTLFELDLTQNTQLTYLDAYQMINISELDLTQNTLLQHLNLESIANITNLDISQNVNLTYLNCDALGIEEIDISQNLQLTYLRLQSTNISNLDISQHIDLEYLNTESTNITTLDISQNISLEYLWAGNNTGLSCIQVWDLTYASQMQIIGYWGADNNVDWSLDCAAGCTNPDASNYDPIATEDDGSCLVSGCMNESACNYDSNATEDNGNCEYPEEGVNCDGQQLTYVPDDGFEFKLILLGYDDVMDDFVLTDNIESLNSLNLDWGGPVPNGWTKIEDLTGIEDFNSLTNLSVDGHLLTELNMSNNLFLEVLSCYGNDPLLSLDVSQNYFLQELGCGACILTDLDLTGNPFLQELNCQDNLLTEINLTQNIYLEQLNLQSNQLTGIDLSQNIALYDVDLSSNYLSEIDLSALNLLYRLQVDNNYLQSLDISQNTLLFGQNNQIFDADYNLIYCINVWEGFSASGYNYDIDNFTEFGTDCSDSSVTNPCDTIYVDNFVYVTDTLYIDGVITDTLYVDNFIIDTITIEVPIVEYDTIIEIQYLDTLYVDNFIIDTIIQTEYITDTIFETEYVDVIITEYIDCDTGLPCSTAIDVLIDKSKTDGKIYNLLGQEINRREGIYIENGEVKYRLH